MPSSLTVQLLIHRLRRKPKRDPADYEFTRDDEQVRPRPSATRRLATTIAVPPTLLHTPLSGQSFYKPADPTIMIYSVARVEKPAYTSMRDIPPIRADECLWIDIPTVCDDTLLSGILERFQVHQLALDDIDTIAQRPKLTVFDDALFFVAKLISLDARTHKTSTEQICFYLKENVLITFRQQPSDVFNQIQKKIEEGRGRVRTSKIDYLFYLVFDTIVDQYMNVLEKMNNQAEDIEKHLMTKLSRNTLETIYDLKRDMLYFRSAVAPLKEIINRLQKEDETQIIQARTIIYLKDLYDHVAQVNDVIDAYREALSSFIDFYMMLNSNGMNEVVKTLTIISTIFIPLTFIGGVYGMNFDNMPEIHWKYGYLIVLTFMLSVTIVMLACFKRKKWF